MPSRDWKQRIQDIIQSVSEIQRSTIDMTFTEFQADDTIRKSVLYDLMIIGEAAINVPYEIKSRYPNIPWRLMGDMRNVIAHEYFQVKLDKVWETIQNDIPLLLPQLQDLLEREGEEFGSIT